MDNSMMFLLVGTMAAMSNRRGRSATNGDIAVLASQVEAIRKREQEQDAYRARMLDLAKGLLCGSVTDEQASERLNLINGRGVKRRLIAGI